MEIKYDIINLTYTKQTKPKLMLSEPYIFTRHIQI